MIIIKESSFNDLFAEKIALLSLEDNYIILTFVKPFSIGRGKNYKKGETIFYEIFSVKDLHDFKNKLNIKSLPTELVDNEQFLKVFYFMGGK